MPHTHKKETLNPTLAFADKLFAKYINFGTQRAADAFLSHTRASAHVVPEASVRTRVW